MLILEPGFDGTCGLAVELKWGRHHLTPEQMLSPPQVAWLAKARKKKWRTAVVREDFEKFKAVVMAHITGPGAGASVQDAPPSAPPLGHYLSPSGKLRVSFNARGL